MDPGEESELGTAAFPPPAPAATSAPGSKIFVISPVPGNIYDVDHYYYAPSADVTSGDFATLIAFGAHYRLPIAIFNCPDLVAFQVKHASTIVPLFFEVPPPILMSGSCPPRHWQCLFCFCIQACGFYFLFCSPSVSRDFYPPSVTAATRASGSTVAPGMGSYSGFPAWHPSRPPRCPDPEGVDSPSTVMGRMGGIKGMEGMGGHQPSGRSSYVSGFSSFSTLY